MRTLASLLISVTFAVGTLHAGQEIISPQQGKELKEAGEKTAIDLYQYQLDYVGGSEMRGPKRGYGDQDVLSNSFEYGHRFLIKGNLYLRAGISYERMDFGTSGAPIPNHLQSIRLPLALEYIEQNHVGATIQIEPGFFFENEIRGNSFDIPWEAYVTIPVRNDKLFAIIGAAGAMYYEYPVIPVAGVIWLLDEAKKWRVQALFPRPAIVYNMNEDWEFQILGEIKGGGYRTDDNRVPRLNHGVVEYYEYRTGLQVTYSHLKPFDIVLNAGWAFERDFDYFRAGQEYKSEPAPYVRLGINAEF